MLNRKSKLLPSHSSIDPRPILARMFPGGKLSYFSDEQNADWSDDVFQMNWFPDGLQPVNCNVLARGHDAGNPPGMFPHVPRREFFFAEAEGVWFVFRIATAFPGKGYDEWVSGISYREVGTSDTFNLYARDYIRSRCPDFENFEG